jgi:hypothetical protein
VRIVKLGPVIIRSSPTPTLPQSANYPLHTFTHLDEIALNGTELFLPWI